MSDEENVETSLEEAGKTVQDENAPLPLEQEDEKDDAMPWEQEDEKEDDEEKYKGKITLFGPDVKKYPQVIL